MSAGAPSASDLAKQAADETNQAISQETSPYNVDISNLRGAEGSALADLDKTYGNVLPYVKDAAQFVGDYYDKGIKQEGAIYDAAIARLNQYFGTQAAYAQSVAQKIGGPVSLESFTAPLNYSMFEAPMAAAGGLLRANALAQGGVQEAAAFAGKVFPLLNMEQKAQLRSSYEGQISSIQKEIDRIRAGASGRTQTRLEQLQEQQHQYQLDQARLQLDRLNAERNWKIQQAQLANQKQQLAQDKIATMGYYDKVWRDKQGKLHTSRIYTLAGQTQQDTVAAQKASQAETTRHDIAGEALTQAQINASKANQAAAEKHNQQVITINQKDAAGKYIDALLTPGQQTVTYTRYDKLTAEQAAGQNKANLIPDGHGGWYKATKVTVPVKAATMSNPSDIYYFLVSHGIPQGIAKAAVQNRFQLPDTWTPHKRTPGGSNKAGPPAPGQSEPGPYN